MAKIAVNEDYAVAASAVWAKLSDFGRLDAWMPGIERCESTGEGVGSVRSLEMGPMKVVERLESLDPDARTLSYSMVEGPLPVQNFLATIEVGERGPGQCHVEWSAEFDLPEGLALDRIAPALEGSYGGALRALKSLLEG